jgi:hypothetical protein
MFDLKSKQEVDIYVSTLFALARDARKQNKDEAYLFIAKYLHGLVPDADIDAMHDECYLNKVAPPAPPPAPKPEPEPEQPKYVPPPVMRRVPRQSPTLAW